MQRQVIFPVADVYGVPDKTAFRGKFETQLLFGEIFLVEEEKNGWCKGTCAHDGYPGHVETSQLSKTVTPATHVVTAARSHTYRDETIKSPAIDTLSFGSLVSVTGTHGKFAQINGGVWIYRQHISPTAAFDKDHVATAMKFLETPYYWGGRSAFGIDCSGLVQVILARAGIKTERDTEQQVNTVGAPADTPRRGDIVYFKRSHVGVMVDSDSIICADGDGPKESDGTGFEMRVRIEPLAAVTGRSGGILSIRRI